MKNQYFGDFNDFKKYRLLRALQSGNDLKLLVSWMLTPYDDRQDGQKRFYLQQPQKYRKLDPELYDGLSRLLKTSTEPNVSLIENSNLLPRTLIYSEIVPDNLRARKMWQKGLMDFISDTGVDIVFADPDNGIEVKSEPLGKKFSSKFIAWTEIRQIWDAGCSLLIYQHFPREPRDAFIERILWELRRYCDGASYIEPICTPHVVFFIIAQPKHADDLSNIRNWEAYK